MKTFKFRETLELIKMGNPEPTPFKKDLVEDLEKLKQDTVELQVIRKGKKIPLSLSPVKDIKGEYKLGIWVRDNTQGIGTLTFVDQNGNYGALGHGISDVDTGELLHIDAGIGNNACDQHICCPFFSCGRCFVRSIYRSISCVGWLYRKPAQQPRS